MQTIRLKNHYINWHNSSFNYIAYHFKDNHFLGVNSLQLAGLYLSNLKCLKYVDTFPLTK